VSNASKMEQEESVGAGKKMESERTPRRVVPAKEETPPPREEILASARRSLLGVYGREILKQDVFRLRASSLLEQNTLSPDEAALVAEIEGVEYARMSDAVLEFAERTVQRIYGLDREVLIDRNRLVLRADALREGSSRIKTEKTEDPVTEGNETTNREGRFAGKGLAFFMAGLTLASLLGLMTLSRSTCHKVCALSGADTSRDIQPKGDSQ